LGAKWARLARGQASNDDEKILHRYQLFNKHSGSTFVGNRRLVGGIRGQLFGTELNWTLAALLPVKSQKPEDPSIDL